jgi:hypothetical protein
MILVEVMMQCDVCGDCLDCEEARLVDDILAKAQKKGWHREKGKDLCPECEKKKAP